MQLTITLHANRRPLALVTSLSMTAGGDLAARVHGEVAREMRRLEASGVTGADAVSTNLLADKASKYATAKRNSDTAGEAAYVVVGGKLVQLRPGPVAHPGLVMHIDVAA